MRKCIHIYSPQIAVQLVITVPMLREWCYNNQSLLILISVPDARESKQLIPQQNVHCFRATHLPTTIRYFSLLYSSELNSSKKPIGTIVAATKQLPNNCSSFPNLIIPINIKIYNQ